MNKSLSGKKLLVLGGMIRTSFLVERAKEMGIYVVVADLDETSPAKKIADEAVLMDVTDVEAIVDYCANNKIDGIITAHTDLLLKPYYEATQLLKLPCYLTPDMIEVSTDKEQFNSMCKKYEVPVPNSMVIERKEFEKSVANMKFPVFIKPLDGSGSRGATACYSPDLFVENCLQAEKYSKQGKVLIEELLTGTDFGVDYLIFDGVPYLLSMHDRQICEDRPSAVNHSNLQILPSKHLMDYKDSLDKKVKNMIVDMQFKNGLLFFQGFANENEIKFFEMGCRFGSTWNYIDEYFIGKNPLDIMIEFALTGVMDEDICKSINPEFNGFGAVISLLTNKKEGKIIAVKGIDELYQKNEIKCIMQEYGEGDSFVLDNKTDISLLRLQLAADTYEELVEAINYVYDTVDFIDESGKTILSQVYSTEKLNYKNL